MATIVDRELKISKVESFSTKDGEVFSTLIKAESHARTLVRNEHLQKLLMGHSIENIYFDDEGSLTVTFLEDDKNKHCLTIYADGDDCARLIMHIGASPV